MVFVKRRMEPPNSYLLTSLYCLLSNILSPQKPVYFSYNTYPCIYRKLPSSSLNVSSFILMGYGDILFYSISVK